MNIAVYPGTFDPVTNGHLDIIKRVSKLFDKVIVVINENFEKKTLFTEEERKNLILDGVKDLPNIEVMVTNMMTVDFAKEIGASVIIRGLRMVSDFDYELQMSTFNHILNDDIETMFIMSSHEYSFLSSSSVKEIVRFHGDVSKFVTPKVEEALKEKIK